MLVGGRDVGCCFILGMRIGAGEITTQFGHESPLEPIREENGFMENFEDKRGGVLCRVGIKKSSKNSSVATHLSNQLFRAGLIINFETIRSVLFTWDTIKRNVLFCRISSHVEIFFDQCHTTLNCVDYFFFVHI